MRKTSLNTEALVLIILLTVPALSYSQTNSQQEENEHQQLDQHPQHEHLQPIPMQANQSPELQNPPPSAFDLAAVQVEQIKQAVARQQQQQQQQQQYQQQQVQQVQQAAISTPSPVQPLQSQPHPMQLQTQSHTLQQIQQQQPQQQLQQPQQQLQQPQQQIQQPQQQIQQPQQQIQQPQLHQPIMQYQVAQQLPVVQSPREQTPPPPLPIPMSMPPPTPPQIPRQQTPLTSYSTSSYNHQSNSPLYLGHNPFIEILRPNSYADDNIVTLNLSHSHIYEIDSDAFVGQRFEHIDLSNNKLGLIHSRSFRIGPTHSRHNPYNPHNNSSKQVAGVYPTRRPPPAHPKSVTIDFSHNPAIVALSGAFDHIDVPNCLLNFTNSTVELKFGAFKKYFKEHPGHIIDIESIDCCEQEWLLGYKHNFVPKTHCDHDPNLFLAKLPQQTIIDSCIAYVTSARHSMTIQGPSIIHQVAAAPRGHSNSHTDNQYTTYLILGGTAMILTSLSIYIIFYMFSLKAAFVYQMQNKS